MVWLRNATKDDYSLNLDVNQDQYQFVASYKNILDYAFYKKDKERTHAFIICDEEVAVGVIEYSDLYEIMAYNLCYLFIDRSSEIGKVKINPFKSQQFTTPYAG